MIRISPEATEQIRRASEWWRVHRPDAIDAIDVELRQIFETLLGRRAIGQRAPTARRPNLMRLHLRRVHYYLYYELDDDEVEVLAFWHTSRGIGPDL